MKSLLLGLFLLAASLPLRSQTDSLAPYYPLHTGNTWEYQAGSPPYQYEWVTITGDTLMPNGIRYAVFAGESVHGRLYGSSYPTGTTYERFDSATGCVYMYEDYPAPSERVVDSVACLAGDRVSSAWLTCDSVTQTSFLGESTISKYFNWLVIPYGYQYGLTKRLGWSWYSHSEEWSDMQIHTSTMRLVYARINGLEFGTPVDVREPSPGAPSRFSLNQNFPNPFNPSTTLGYVLPSRLRVSVIVYDVLGRRVATLVNEVQSPGPHRVIFDAGGLSSGMYIWRVEAGSFSGSRSMLLLR